MVRGVYKVDTLKKNVYIHVRIDPIIKNEFQEVCERKAINSSELIRKMVKEWTDKNK